MLAEFPDEIFEPKWRGATGNAPAIGWEALSTESVVRTQPSALHTWLLNAESKMVSRHKNFDLAAALEE